MRTTFSNLWDGFNAETRTRLIKGTILSIIIVVGWLGYVVTDQEQKRNQGLERPTETPIRLGDQLAEDDIRKQIETDRDRQTEHNTVIASQVSDLKVTLNQMNQAMAQLNEQKNQAPLLGKAMPPNALPQVEKAMSYPPPVPLSSTSLEEAEPVFVGAIAHTAGDVINEPVASKKKSSIYLAPGFMEGILLTGLRADTVAQANEDPEPMLIRIQAPAVLPNHIKANLKGCFVIARGFGKLNKERIDARLVSLHCVNQQQQAVIDEKIKGYLVDADGIKGLNGRVVTKAGANLARVFIAGVFGSAGDVMKASASALSVSPLGTVENTLSGQAALKKGFGQGLSDAAYDVRKIFLDLVRQSSPVIEVGPAKKMTVVLIEGVNLTLHDINDFRSN